MADFAGVSDQTIRNWQKQPGFPAAGDGSVCLWDLAVWRATVDGTIAADIDDDLVDGDSPGLERFRLARAEQEEIKLQRMRGDFIPREDVHTAVIETSAVMKEAGERLVRTFGNDAAEIFNDAWAEAVARLRAKFGDDRADSDDDGAEDSD